MQILLVEDNAADVRLMKEGLAETNVPFQLTVAVTGEAALEILHKGGEFSGGTLPDLILLDLNLPGKSGVEVLEEVKGNPELRRIPVVVLTSSRAQADVLAAYERGANCYLHKAQSLDHIYDLARTLTHHWFDLAMLPSKANAKA